VWADNAEVDEYAEEQTLASCFKTATRVNHWNGLYFGGVAFKYQRPVLEENLPKAAQCAVSCMDVIMTSGPGTGMQSDVQKVQLMKEGAGEHPLGLASGVSPENISTFLPYVDVYLVASGIETSRYSGILIPERTQSLSEAIHSYHV
jgi:predicted TIM-barrel enzyme